MTETGCVRDELVLRWDAVEPWVDVHGQEWVRLDDVATALGKHPQSVRRWLRQYGMKPAGARFVHIYRAAEIEAWVERWNLDRAVILHKRAQNPKSKFSVAGGA